MSVQRSETLNELINEKNRLWSEYNFYQTNLDSEKKALSLEFSEEIYEKIQKIERLIAKVLRGRY